MDFIGLGGDYYTFNVDLATEDIDVDYQKWAGSIRDELEDFTIVGDKISIKGEEDKIRMKSSFVLSGFRMGLSIGIVF